MVDKLENNNTQKKAGHLQGNVRASQPDLTWMENNSGDATAKIKQILAGTTAPYTGDPSGNAGRAQVAVSQGGENNSLLIKYDSKLYSSHSDKEPKIKLTDEQVVRLQAALKELQAGYAGGWNEPIIQDLDAGFGKTHFEDQSTPRVPTFFDDDFYVSKKHPGHQSSSNKKLDWNEIAQTDPEIRALLKQGFVWHCNYGSDSELLTEAKAKAGEGNYRLARAYDLGGNPLSEKNVALWIKKEHDFPVFLTSATEPHFEDQSEGTPNKAKFDISGNHGWKPIEDTVADITVVEATDDPDLGPYTNLLSEKLEVLLNKSGFSPEEGKGTLVQRLQKIKPPSIDRFKNILEAALDQVAIHIETADHKGADYQKSVCTALKENVFVRELTKWAGKSPIN